MPHTSGQFEELDAKNMPEVSKLRPLLMSSSESDEAADATAQLALLVRHRASEPSFAVPASSAAAGSASSGIQLLPSASDSDTEEEDPHVLLPAQHLFEGRIREETTGTFDRRGKYDRNAMGVQKRVEHAAYAWRHRELVSNNKLGVPCTSACPFGQKCWLNITPGVLLAAHEHVYGANTSFEASTRPGKKDIYGCDLTQAQTQQQHRTLMLIWVTHTTAEPPQPIEMYSVEGRGPVCADYACAAYDMDRSWKKLHADALKGELRADAQALQHNPTTMGQSLASAHGSHRMFETKEWWRWWLYLEDQMPNEPTIIHRIVVWRSVYDEEYCPDLAWWGTTQPLSYPRWCAIRLDALRDLSIDFYGDVASTKDDDVRLTQEMKTMKLSGGGFGVPVVNLSLRKRAKHSNFAACDECTASKKKWVEYRRDPNRSLGDAEAIKRDLFKHIHLVKLERQRAQEFHYICSQRAGWLCEYDDKCGSQFLHLPAPEAGRFCATEAGSSDCP